MISSWCLAEHALDSLAIFALRLDDPLPTERGGRLDDRRRRLTRPSFGRLLRA